MVLFLTGEFPNFPLCIVHFNAHKGENDKIKPYTQEQGIQEQSIFTLVVLLLTGEFPNFPLCIVRFNVLKDEDDKINVLYSGTRHI